MSLTTDVRVLGAEIEFIPVTTRVPLKFGHETLTSVTCARARVTVQNHAGNKATGLGETPLSAQWVWPGSLPYAHRHERLKAMVLRISDAWRDAGAEGHALEIGWDFVEKRLPQLMQDELADNPGAEAMPHLAGLLCASVLDQAIHDAYGKVNGLPVYETYNRQYLSRDLGSFLEPADGSGVSFKGLYPADFLVSQRTNKLRAWHLVGGLDAIDPGELKGDEPQDGHPVLLRDWIRRDGLKCLKVKLRGNDAAWDWDRLLKVGRISLEEGVEWLTADFNCTVHEPAYVNTILDRLRDEHPRLYAMILYVEQPFPYDLEHHAIDAHSVAARKPLFLDESAHDWRLIRLGRSLGWNGVALKTCKTQSGALLSACWARAHGMQLMVQDLTNPMLAQIPHVLLAAHVGTIMGVETNAMQFYPAASEREARVHPGLYQRREGFVDLSTLKGPGFGYGFE